MIAGLKGRPSRELTPGALLSLAWPDRIATPAATLDLAELASLPFEAPDESRFPALRLARERLASASQACGESTAITIQRSRPAAG